MVEEDKGNDTFLGEVVMIPLFGVILDFQPGNNLLLTTSR
jgi:hypothetical protein